MSVTLDAVVMDFPGARALDHVGAEFRFDEVHGLIGENGAGKSTFVNILGGSLQPTAGRITVEGRPVRLDSPRAALAHGIAHVSQEGSLVPGLTGAQNILLGDEPNLLGAVIRRRALLDRARGLVETWFPGLSIDLDTPVQALAVADRKIIEIVRALRGRIRLLILDEPTATLQNREKRQLWSIIRSLPQRGVGVVLISHFLSEVLALSERITVLRDGRHVGTRAAAETTESELVNLMLRRTGSAEGRASAPAATTGDAVLRVRDWRVGAVHVPEFTLRAGEIVGLIGLTGAGHFGFARSLYTRDGVVRGVVEIGGEAVTEAGLRAMQRRGVAFVPDHRMENALMPDGTVAENMAMVHPAHAARPGGILSLRAERREVGRLIDLLKIRTSGPAQAVKNLSGGNKQKVSLGKWLYGAGGRYRVMIFIEPTEGVDVGAKQEIYAQIRRIAAQGAGVLIASSDLLEIEQLTSRVVPFVAGRPGSDIEAPAYSEARFIAAMTGEAA